MKKYIITALLLAACCAQANSTQSDWASMMLQSVKTSPRIQGLRYEATAGGHRAASMAKPLFNPALETEIEREGDAFNYRIGLATDIDWWDQRSIRTKLGNQQQTVAQLTLQNASNSLLSEAIKTQISVELRERNYVLAKAQVEQDITLLSLVKAEVVAGEASLTDVAILQAIMGENLVAEADALIAYLEAQSQLDSLLGRKLPPSNINAEFWQTAIVLPDIANLQQLPSMQLAYFHWLQAKQEVELRVAETKPSPSVAMNIGEQDGTATVAMSLSVPLTFRNNYQDEAHEARQMALAAEQHFRSEMSQLQNRMHQLVQQLSLLKQRYNLWLTSSGDGFITQSETLNSRFTSGDLGIADYQGLIQQLRRGMQAGLVIEETFKLTYVDYLTSAGKLEPFMELLAKAENKP